MRADRRFYGRAWALPLHVLLSAKASPPRALIKRLCAQMLVFSTYESRRVDAAKCLMDRHRLQLHNSSNDWFSSAGRKYPLIKEASRTEI